MSLEGFAFSISYCQLAGTTTQMMGSIPDLLTRLVRPWDPQSSSKRLVSQTCPIYWLHRVGLFLPRHKLTSPYRLFVWSNLWRCQSSWFSIPRHCLLSGIFNSLKAVTKKGNLPNEKCFVLSTTGRVNDRENKTPWYLFLPLQGMPSREDSSNPLGKQRKEKQRQMVGHAHSPFSLYWPRLIEPEQD